MKVMTCKHCHTTILCCPNLAVSCDCHKIRYSGKRMNIGHSDNTMEFSPMKNLINKARLVLRYLERGEDKFFCIAMLESVFCEMQNGYGTFVEQDAKNKRDELEEMK